MATLFLILEGSNGDVINFPAVGFTTSFDGEVAQIRVTLPAESYDKLSPRPDLVITPVTEPDPEPGSEENYIYTISDENKAKGFTIKSYTDMKWDIEQLVAQGHVIKTLIEKEPEEITTPEIIAAPTLKMTPLAQGSTLEDFEAQGWDADGMVKHGYAVWENTEAVYDGPWPRNLGNDCWVNQHGEEFDTKLHARTRGRDPLVKKDGHWKVKPPKKTAPEIPAPPVASPEPDKTATPSADDVLAPAVPVPPASQSASTVPVAPGVPNAPTVPAVPEIPAAAGSTVDDDVASILSNWSGNASNVPEL